jgi:hypothetical protein
VRLILPIRVKRRGGRSWIMTPDGGPAVTKARADRALIGGLKNAHKFVGATQSDLSSAKARAYACHHHFMLHFQQWRPNKGRFIS